MRSPRKKENIALGQSVKGFAYTYMKQKLRLTTKEVGASCTSFGWGIVSEVRKDLGVFVDTGLPDKQVVVSLAHFARNQRNSGRRKVISCTSN